jgi:hypothetical protein
VVQRAVGGTETVVRVSSLVSVRCTGMRYSAAASRITSGLPECGWKAIASDAARARGSSKIR